MTAYQATSLFVYANKNRSTAVLTLPAGWSQLTKRAKAGEIRAVGKLYKTEPGCPELPTKLQQLPEEELDKLAMKLIELMVRVFNKPVGSVTKTKK